MPYPNQAGSGKGDIFVDNITPFGFTAGIACLIGYFMVKDEDLTF